MGTESELIAAVERKRKALGLSLRALSNEVSVSFSSLARFARGEGAPDNNTKVRLLEWLGADADDLGESFERVVHVHFRAAKNVSSTAIGSLLRASDCIKSAHPIQINGAPGNSVKHGEPDRHHHLTKDELEKLADWFRSQLGLSADQPLDSLAVKIEGVSVSLVTETHCLDSRTRARLTKAYCHEWSAMSVPLDGSGKWEILLNDCHTLERQRVTLLEEYWHILLGHKLTKVAKIADVFGRTYEHAEEHDAYYLASASLLPRDAVLSALKQHQASGQIAQRFGTSPELVDYRIKRLGLWHAHIKKAFTIG